jgi:hypothetical protein
MVTITTVNRVPSLLSLWKEAIGMFLAEFFQALIGEIETFVEGTLRLAGPGDRLRRELRILFGRGELDQAAYFRLMARLEHGYYIEGELRVLQRQARARRPDPFVGHIRTSLDHSLETVYHNRARLIEAQVSMQYALRVLEGERAWLEEQAADFYQRAQRALPDESAARDDLELRQQCLEQAAGVAVRLERVKQELRRMARLEARLRFYESDLLVLRSREQLAMVEYAVQKRGLPPR